MQRYLKAAGLIDQCTRCFSLRPPFEEECPTCRKLFDVHVTDTRPLPLADISSDATPGDTFFSTDPRVMGRA